MSVLELLRSLGPPVHAIHGNVDSCGRPRRAAARASSSCSAARASGWSTPPGATAGRLEQAARGVPATATPWSSATLTCPSTTSETAFRSSTPAPRPNVGARRRTRWASPRSPTGRHLRAACDRLKRACRQGAGGEACSDSCLPPRRPTQPRDYGAVDAVWSALVGGLLAAARARSREAPPAAELPVLGLATFALTKALSKEKVGSWVRSAVVEREPDGEQPKGSGLRFVAGELLTCPRCLGAWTSVAIVGLRVISHARGPHRREPPRDVRDQRRPAGLLQLSLRAVQRGRGRGARRRGRGPGRRRPAGRPAGRPGIGGSTARHACITGPIIPTCCSRNHLVRCPLGDVWETARSLDRPSPRLPTCRAPCGQRADGRGASRDTSRRHI